MQVDGRDPEREAYAVRVAHGGREIRAWVPEALMGPARPRHHDAYAWISANQARLEAAIIALDAGRGDTRFRGLCLQEGD